MSLSPFAPAFLPHYQPPSDPTLSPCNSTMMSLPLAQLFCGMPPPFIPSPASPSTQPITDGTFILLLLPPKNPSKQDAEVHQPLPGPSSLLSSPLQHQVQCLQAIHKTIQQFNQNLKAEQLDRKTFQLIVFQLRNDFALLRHLLLFSVTTIPISDSSLKNSVTKPPINPKSNPTSNGVLLACAAEPSIRRTTPEGAVRPPRAKTNNSANADFQSSHNTRDTPPTQAQHLTSRTSKLENIFAGKIATYTSITSGNHSI